MNNVITIFLLIHLWVKCYIYIYIYIYSSNVRMIFTDDTIIIYKNNNIKPLQIQEAICMKNKK